MKKLSLLIALTFITGTTVYGMQQPAIKTDSTPVCTAKRLSPDQTKKIVIALDKILAPLMLPAEQKDQLIKLIIDQALDHLQPQAMTQSWFARNKKQIFIGATIGAVSLALTVLWYVYSQQKHKALEKKLMQSHSAQNQASGQLGQADDEIARLGQERDRLQAALQECRASIASAKPGDDKRAEFLINAARTELAQKDQQLAAALQQAAQLGTEKGQLAQALGNASTQNTQLQQRLQAVSAQQAEAAARAQTLAQESQQLHAQLEAKEQENRTQQESLKAHAEQLEFAKEETRKLAQQLRQGSRVQRNDEKIEPSANPLAAPQPPQM
ncbi:MAG: hypothetical protein WC365_04105 [Candidatus Babeliales bacterium]|jgi:myosin heavy subunit